MACPSSPICRRDSGYVAGALIAGRVADAPSCGGAIALVAGLTAASGLWVLVDMPPRAIRPTQAQALAARGD